MGKCAQRSVCESSFKQLVGLLEYRHLHARVFKNGLTVTRKFPIILYDEDPPGFGVLSPNNLGDMCSKPDHIQRFDKVTLRACAQGFQPRTETLLSTGEKYRALKIV